MARVTDPGMGQQKAQHRPPPKTGHWLQVHALHHHLNLEREKLLTKVTGDTGSQPQTYFKN